MKYTQTVNKSNITLDLGQFLHTEFSYFPPSEI